MSKKFNQVEAREALESALQNHELWCDAQKHQVEMLKVTYDQLIAKGFTLDQALEIVKARGYTLGGS